MLSAVLVLCGLAAGCGLAVAVVGARTKADEGALADHIDSLLPQTQCGQCGYSGCRPYAAAMATGEADFNQCPPGGESTIRALADLLGREFKPLNPANGQERPRTLAVIDETVCIGCTLCIKACPVDAILGANKQMHTVIAAECTGCELCLPPCPVDCIEMVSIPLTVANWSWPRPRGPERPAAAPGSVTG